MARRRKTSESEQREAQMASVIARLLRVVVPGYSQSDYFGAATALSYPYAETMQVLRGESVDVESVQIIVVTAASLWARGE